VPIRATISGDQSLRHSCDAANAKRKPPPWQTFDTR
jgi:hypothetical protein